MSGPASVRKRKRSTSPHGKSTLKVKTFELETSHGPRLASFPAVEAPENTPFTVYGSTSQGELLAGETDRIEFDGREHASGSHYLVAVYHKSKGSLNVRRAPLHVLERQVKRLKTLKTAAVSGELTQFQQQRAELGTTFGTKKAQAAIRAAARNKVDVNAMSSATDHLQARIEAQTKALPTKEEAAEIADAGRMIPPYNLNATRAEDAYPLAHLIPEAEFSSINIKDILNAKGKERSMLFPYRIHAWLEPAITSSFPPAADKPHKDNIKIIWYICAMLNFRRVAPKYKDKSELAKSLELLPESVQDGLIGRFMESARDDSLAWTSATETRFNTWLLALMLHVDGFCCDITAIASTLPNATPPKVQTWFKALGCKVGSLSASDRQKRGIVEDDARKWATLKVPLEFPKIKSKPHGKR